MRRNTDEFFAEKKEWSKVKDQILSCYLKPYFSKIKYTKKPIVYIDGFAGKGKFDDGTDGSPLIAYAIGKEALFNNNTEYILIENKYFKDLEKNVASFSECKVINGNYEENIEKLITLSSGKNLFLYIDPFGIKNIKYEYLKLMNKSNLHSAEFLMNLNSFGFVREGCRLLNTTLDKIEDDYEKTVDYDEDKSKNTVENMNNIAGGEYWQSIIEKLKSGVISGFEAEKEFVNEYCKMVSKECNFKYVINIPIRIKSGTPPKYRLVFGTNHIDAIILMNDNMCNRFEELKNIQNRGCLTLFMEDSENEIISEKTIRNNINNMLNSVYINYYDLFINYIKKFGITKTKVINNCLCQMEELGIIDIKREPYYTPTGKKSKFVMPSKDKKVFIRRCGDAYEKM